MEENVSLINYCKQILSCTKQLMEQDLDLVIEGKKKLQLPVYRKSKLEQLINGVKNIFSNEDIFLKIDHDVVIVGDLHGHLFDLFRILYRFGFPPYTNYLFLGDLVDRGEYSLEVVVIIFTLKYLYPEYVHIIRGNHEFVKVSKNSTFLEEISQLYQNSAGLFNLIFEAFSYLPLAAQIYEKNLCLHGGISPSFEHMNQIKQIKRPIDTYSDDPVLCGLLWSDPSKHCYEFGPSMRKSGFLFGAKSFDRFMKNNKFHLMIRGHECVPEGFKYEFDNRLITVFSASNYCNKVLNKCGVLCVSKDSIEPVSMLPLGYTRRYRARFFSFIEDEECCDEAGAISSMTPSPLSLMNSRTQSTMATPTLLTLVKYRQRSASKSSSSVMSLFK